MSPCWLALSFKILCPPNLDRFLRGSEITNRLSFPLSLAVAPKPSPFVRRGLRMFIHRTNYRRPFLHHHLGRGEEHVHHHPPSSSAAARAQCKITEHPNHGAISKPNYPGQRRSLPLFECPLEIITNFNPLTLPPPATRRRGDGNSESWALTSLNDFPP